MTHIKKLYLNYGKAGLNMAKWGMCDFSELEKLQKQFERLSKIDK